MHVCVCVCVCVCVKPVIDSSVEENVITSIRDLRADCDVATDGKSPPAAMETEWL